LPAGPHAPTAVHDAPAAPSGTPDEDPEGVDIQFFPKQNHKQF